MATQRLLVAAILLCGTMQLSTLANAACVCNARGVDGCARCKDHAVIRPQPRASQTPISLPPIGDNCWCNKLRVEPAALPRTCNKHTPTLPLKHDAKPIYIQQNSLPKTSVTYVSPIYNNPNPTYLSPPAPKVTYDAQVYTNSPVNYYEVPPPKPTYEAPVYINPSPISYAPAPPKPTTVYTNQPTNYYAPPTPPPSHSYPPPSHNYPPPSHDYQPPSHGSPPADPVSISLAIRAGKAIAVPEAKLAYGFVKKPLDGLPKIQFSKVPEENLYKLKNEVIVLKKNSCSDHKSVDENHYDGDEEYAKPHDNKIELNLSYKQLGYQKEQFKNPSFRKVVPVYKYPARPSYGVRPVYAKTKVDCGFRPGRVASEPSHSDCSCKE